MPIYYNYGASSGGWVRSSILSLVLIIWAIVCMRVIFKKAWRKWRESIIPIRNVWVLFKIAWIQKDFRLLILPFIVIGLATFLPDNIASIALIIGRILSICAMVVSIALQFKLAKKFNKHRAFGLWLLFLTPIFYGILAFDKSTYNA